ncbi:uncharacterized protein BXZ73DRAFT_91068 [Epithele typhae]|uniref:uncharacterized protein n=1 Tax=Epithele typhae TaxID=378194 RepID=UPI002007E53D|nr:uncharacterized protein BXZ73DRAFT_91068 [Epithele typhae]KAH9925628.1 hypothetical protein BXZ73DRAFT_91068 [Epithele typhae]
MPSPADYAQFEEEYLEGLDPRKRAKALISQQLFDDIWLVLHAPGAQCVGSPQFRWWVRKMFILALPNDLDEETPTDPGSLVPAMVPLEAPDTSRQTLPVVAHDGKRLAVREQIYDVLCVAHARAEHGGRDKTMAEVKRRYTWVPKDLIALFVKYCPTCMAKRTPLRSPPPTPASNISLTSQASVLAPTTPQESPCPRSRT